MTNPAGDDLMAGFQFIPSSLWGIFGPHGSELPPMAPAPAPLGIFVHHTVTPVTDDPCHDAQVVNADGIARFGQLSYSYMFHPSGVVLAGCETRRGAHTIDRNSISFGFAAMGTYTDAPPTDALIKGMCQMALILKRFGWLTAASDVQPHSAIKATICPGMLRPGDCNLIAAVLREDQ